MKRAWWLFVVRALRNALIAVAVMAVIPLAAVVVRGDRVASMVYGWNASATSRSRVVGGGLRAFGVAPDPSITPMQAGQALNELQYRRPANGEFAVIRPVTPLVLPWRTGKRTPDMFPSVPNGPYDGPFNRLILAASVARFSPREQAYLKALAEAPVWRTFELVARAPAVDIVGGQLRLPLPPDALPEQRPMPSYRESAELAHAAVARAAYYLSIGEPRQAEETLRSIVSFGFALIDNGTTMMDEQVGTAIVSTGRDALQWFYMVEHDPRADLTELVAPVQGALEHAGLKIRAEVPPEEARRRLLALLADPGVPRPERFEALKELTLLQCTSARDILFGQRADVRDAIQHANTTLARYPSERALIDLETRLPSVSAMSSATQALQSLLVSPALVAGTVLRNPRMGVCTLLLTAGQ